ncbi:MAG: hydrolase [Capsulimonas sp.]|jgi:lysophospholipase L1-like esterase|nr:hydrolase [Capsulimonas sp.]
MTHGSMIWTIGAISLLAAGAAGAQGNGAFALHDGDRVVFYGDSITDQRLYTTITETYIATRFPEMNIDFTHSGWGGDRVSGGGGGPIDLRLQRDVFPYKPTVMTIMLGMNDAAYKAFDQGIFDTYSNGYKHILDSVKTNDPGVRYTLIVPSPYDDTTRNANFDGGYNSVLLKYGDFIKSLAPAYGATVADFNTPVVAMLQKAKATDADLSQKIIPDRVHPGYSGHLIMAEALLKSWNAPSIVTKVQIDAKGKKVVTADNTKVSDLKTGMVISWTQNDNALPMPLDTNDAATALSLKSSDFMQALNQEPLQVTGLKDGSYTLTIDGTEVGDLSAQDLAAGVNLATLPTPMLSQAMDVRKLTLQHDDQHFHKWRDIQVPGQTNKNAAMQKALPAYLAALDSEEADTVAARHDAAQPKPHHYALTLAAPEPDPALALKPLNGLNLAVGKSYTASDPNVYNYGIGALTDGSWVPDGHTFATGDNAAFPKTVTVDLGSAQKIGTVIIGVPPFGSTKTVRVSVSADGQKFTGVGKATFSLHKEEKHRFSFPGTSARYVRLTYVDHYSEEAGYSANFGFTTELEVYAP